MLDKYYLTTAIDYVNGAPHIGHAYEKNGTVSYDSDLRYHQDEKGNYTKKYKIAFVYSNWKTFEYK